MVRLFVRINVADYRDWRKVFDQFYGERSAMELWAPPRFS